MRTTVHRSSMRLACALALLSAGCARTPPPSNEAPSAAPSAPEYPPAPAPSAAPSALPSAAPTTAASVDRQNCVPRSPAVSFEVENDDIVRSIDARGCPLGESHFKANGYSYQASVDFMTELKKRITANDRNGLADLANYPLRLNTRGKAPLIVKDRAAFLRAYDQLYAPIVALTIIAQDPRNLFCNYRGIMLGDGVLWANNAGGHYGVIAINVR